MMMSPRTRRCFSEADLPSPVDSVTTVPSVGDLRIVAGGGKQES